MKYEKQKKFLNREIADLLCKYEIYTGEANGYLQAAYSATCDLSYLEENAPPGSITHEEGFIKECIAEFLTLAKLTGSTRRRVCRLFDKLLIEHSTKPY